MKTEDYEAFLDKLARVVCIGEEITALAEESKGLRGELLQIYEAEHGTLMQSFGADGKLKENEIGEFEINDVLYVIQRAIGAKDVTITYRNLSLIMDDR